MATVQFTIWVKHKGDADSKAWKERYHEETDHPRRWAKRLIKRFNATRRRDVEEKRVLVRVKVKRNRVSLEHDWRKTNLVTLVTRGSMYDTYCCTRCGLTGKRFGLVRYITPDRGRSTVCRGQR